MFTTIDNQQDRITEFYELLYNGADTTKEKFKKLDWPSFIITNIQLLLHYYCSKFCVLNSKKSTQMATLIGQWHL